MSLNFGQKGKRGSLMNLFSKGGEGEEKGGNSNSSSPVQTRTRRGSIFARPASSSPEESPVVNSRRERSGTISEFRGRSGTRSRSGSVSMVPPSQQSQSELLKNDIREQERSKINQRKNDFFVISLVLPDVTLKEKVSRHMSGQDAIEHMIKKALESSKWAAQKELKAEDYLLKIEGINSIIQPLHLELHRVRVMQVCAKTYVAPNLVLVERTPEMLRLAEESEVKQKDLERAEIETSAELYAMIPNLSKYLELENKETTSLRAKMTVARKEFSAELSQKMEEEENMYMLHKYVDSEPMPLKLPAEVTLVICLPRDGIKKRLRVKPKTIVDEVIGLAFTKYIAVFPQVAEEKKAEDYILKVTGYQDFLFGPDELVFYDYVRRCISKEQEIVLSLVEREEIVKLHPQEKVDYESIVDEVLSVPHPDVRKTAKRLVNVNSKNSGLKLKIKRVEGISVPFDANAMYFVRILFIQGSKEFMEPMYTSLSPENDCKASWEQVFFTSVSVKNIPLGVRLQLSLWQRVVKKGAQDPQSVEPSDVCVGWVNFALYNSDRFMKTGLHAAILWTKESGSTGPLQPDPVGSCMQNVFTKDPLSLFVEFENNLYFRPKYEFKWTELPKITGPEKFAADDVRDRFEHLILSDSLTTFSKSELKELWSHRKFFSSEPAALPKMVYACPWDDDESVCELYEWIRLWPITTCEAIELIGPNVSDPLIRGFGVSMLSKLSDAKFLVYLPQLVQALKFELNHDSDLATLLIQRAFRNRHRIGHYFFWQLKAEMHSPAIAERYGLMLESYLRGCGSHRKELLTQVKVIDMLVAVALKIKAADASVRLDVLRESLSSLKLPSVFQLPLDPRLQVKGLVVEKCKYMDSKKLPLWLVFNNAEEIGNKVTIIFKEGDDLRQDALTLQVLKVFDQLWKEQGMDLRMNPYGVLSTGDGIGMIEVVLNSITMAGINREAGGAMKELQKDTTLNFLKRQNPKEDQLAKCQDNFALSCAGYCVATYVLGIGDRHNDNIMVTMNGLLFHIDFGHFLGNFKSKFGIKREKAPFVFTEQYQAVIGGFEEDRWKLFVRRCKAAFNTLRQNAPLLLNLFYLMLATGIPELQTPEDILYLKHALTLELNDDEATKHIEEKIYESLDCRTTTLNNVIHNLAH